MLTRGRMHSSRPAGHLSTLCGEQQCNYALQAERSERLRHEQQEKMKEEGRELERRKLARRE
eukprot:2669740-Amphidinium_carterae.2